MEYIAFGVRRRDGSTTDAGYRQYGDSDVRTLRFIRHSRDLGFSLQEIGRLFAGRPYSATLRGLASRKLVELERSIERLHATDLEPRLE